jgi:Tfp pilus assembly protein FimV
MTTTTSLAHFFKSTATFKVASVLACSLAMGQAFAADPSEEKPAPAPTASYTVAQSTPIDKLIHTLYANSPLTVGVLRQALVDANPKVITGNTQQRVKAGVSMVVPDHGQIVRNILTPLAAPALPENSDSGPSARDYSVRKPWVRFP